MVKFNRKAAVEMSLSLIIMLVIGLTVLGLVIGFVTNLMNSASSQVQGKLSQAEESQRKEVLDKPGTFALGPKPLSIQSGGVSPLFIKIRNIGTDDIAFNPYSGENVGYGESLLIDMGTGSGEIKVSNSNINGECMVTLSNSPNSIAAGDTGIVTLTVDASDSSCASGDRFYLKVEFAPTSTVSNAKGTDGVAYFSDTIRAKITD